MDLPPTVFLVDDDPAVGDALGLLLRTAGFRVEVFPGAPEFLAAYDPSRPGCVLLDLHMPGMGGMELLKELRRRGSCLPVIIISGQGDVPQAVEAFKGGVLDFFEKPFPPERVRERVEEAFRISLEGLKERAVRSEVAALLGTLTPREKEVLSLYCAFLDPKQIASRLRISLKTLSIHRLRILRKMGARSISALVALLHRWGPPEYLSHDRQ